MPRGQKIKQVTMKNDLFDPKFTTTFAPDSVIRYLQGCILPGQPHHMVLKDKLVDEMESYRTSGKTHPINEIIEDLTMNRNLKKDISGWGLIYYPGVLRNEQGKFPTAEVYINPATIGIGMRVFINLSDRNKEVLNLNVEKMGVNKTIVLYPGEAFSLSTGIAQSLGVILKNTTFEKIDGSKGHRHINIRKDPSLRQLLVMDGYINMEQLTAQAQELLKKKTGIDINVDSIKEKLETSLGKDTVEKAANLITKTPGDVPISVDDEVYIQNLHDSFERRDEIKDLLVDGFKRFYTDEDASQVNEGTSGVTSEE